MSTPQADSSLFDGDRHINRFITSATAITFALATADLIFACAYWNQLYGVPPTRLLQNIASGLIGKRAFLGGMRAAQLGMLLQYAMVSIMVATYYAISSRFHALRQRPWFYGLLYGAVLYVTMNYIVLPLSAAPKSPFVPSWIVCSIVVHLLFGITIAQGARWATQKP
jgi:uncharacterized membrane protein YagU involved in acid resistance